MDTFRVQLPHPQPVANEEEFVTNSGRRIKRPIVDPTPEPPQQTSTHHKDEEDMFGSGLSVLSPSLGDSLSARDDQLSNSVQAELHLSLDRLSENYDADEYKRLQEKSKNSRMILTERQERNLSSRRADEGKGEGGGSGIPRKSANGAMSQDSLDAEEPRLESENSEEFRVSGEDDEDERTVAADSLNYSSSREALTPLSKQSERSNASSMRTPVPVNGRQTSEDKYADLRFNPNWRELNLQKTKPSPMVVDFKAAPRLNDSLEEPQSSQRGGGAIVVHKKELYSPIVPELGTDNFSLPNARSISPTRLSADPQRLRQTNAKYEDEFNKMLKAEILNEEGADEAPDFALEDHHQPRQVIGYPEPASPRKESYSVLIRKLDSQDRSNRTASLAPSEDAPHRIGGYQLLPDRHRIPSPSRGPSTQEMTITNHYQSTPKPMMSPGRYQSPEGYYTEKKDPLVALSPRNNRRNPLVPTPPKMPKPKDIDFVELNKQRLGRKTNSAGYLDLHKKRSRPVEPVKARSHSELKNPVAQASYSGGLFSPEAEYDHGTVEGIWAQQADRLKIAKGENVNKGKVLRPSPKRHAIRNGPTQGNTFLVSPNQRNPYWENSVTDPARNHGLFAQNQVPPGLDSRLQHQNNRDLVRVRHPLPVPSQQAPPLSPKQYQGVSSPSKEELVDSLNESGFRRAYFSPRMHPGISDEESPLMKAYQSKYTTDVYEPTVYANRSNVLRQNFSEQNLALPPQETLGGPPDMWTNPNVETELPPTTLPPSNHSSGRPTRKVTFLGDTESIAIVGISNGDPIPAPPAGAIHKRNRYQFPLPPTPPSKSLSHTVNRRRQSDGKENEGYYDVREDNYPVLPPILKSHQKTSPLKQSPNSKNIDSPKSGFEEKGSYLEQHEKQKKKFQYKIYTLNDYQNLKKDVKLGGLGPDLESAREKMEKKERAKQYAELIRREHMANAATVKQKENFGSEIEIPYNTGTDNYRFTTNMDEKQRREMLEKRKRAIEYSKKIPKPKPKPNPSPQNRNEKPNAILSNYSSSHSPSNGPTESEGVDFNWGLLQMLKDRHDQEKAQVAAFSGNS